MKVTKIRGPGDMWPFIKSELPASLTTLEIPVGYGYGKFIYRSDYRRGFIDRFFDRIGDAVAQVDGTEVELFHQEYFSDFEALCQKYERNTGYNTHLKYWEAA